MSHPVRSFVYPNAAMERGVPQLRSGSPLSEAYAFLSEPASHGEALTIHRLLYKALVGGRHTVSRAAKAELFFSFITPYRPPFHQWTAADEAAMGALAKRTDVSGEWTNRLVARFSLMRECEHVYSGRFVQELVHLTPQNRHRHFVIAEGAPGACNIFEEYRHRGPPPHDDLLLKLDADTIFLYPNRQINMPYLSSVRWSDALEATGGPPWRAPPGPRRYLAAFSGSTRGAPRAAQIRTRVVEACRAAARERPEACGHFLSVSIRGERAAIERTLSLKRSSTFCIEPPGYSSPRKSAIDSILLGCIPVLFFSAHEFANYMPVHFAWGANASVVIEPDAFLSGQVDLFGLLAAIPLERIREMQTTIATFARQLVYSLDGRYRGDAVETLLRHLARHPADARAPARGT